MPTTKHASTKKPAQSTAGPTAGRPHIEDYGIPKSKTGLLPWSHVTHRMTEALHYWVSTVGPGGRPHATPVDGLWLDDQLYFGGSPKTRRNRNLVANPAACVHLESGTDVLILHGDVHDLRDLDQALAVRLSEASKQKYGYGPTPEGYRAAGVFAFRPQLVFAWKEFPKDATRWQL